MKLRRAAALMGAMILTFGVVGAVNADSGNPAHIQAAVNGNTVTVSGDWAWDKCTDKKIIGWAVAWGEPGWTSNPVPEGRRWRFLLHGRRDAGQLGHSRPATRAAAPPAHCPKRSATPTPHLARTTSA